MASETISTLTLFPFVTVDIFLALKTLLVSFDLKIFLVAVAKANDIEPTISSPRDLLINEILNSRYKNVPSK
jgi:hypothetical protein